MSLLNLIFQHVQEGYITIWSKRGDSKHTHWINVAEANALDQAQRIAEEMDLRGWDAYFSTCPAARSKDSPRARITAADASCIPAFFVDFDTRLDETKQGKNLPADMDAAMEALDALPCPPTVCVCSGHGVHAYWVLTTPLNIGSVSELESAKVLLKRFSRAVAAATGFTDVDAHASEPARVLRVPGTHNHKYETILDVRIIDRSENREYAVDELVSFADQVVASAKQEAYGTTPVGAPATSPAIPPAPVPSKAPDGARDLFTEFDEDERLLAKARKDQLFDDLFAGNWQSRYKSQSEADIALANKLAFWFGGDVAAMDIDRMDRVFRRSGLFREKWDRPQSGSTYGFLTLEKAAAECRQTYNPRAYFEKQAAQAVSGRRSERHTLADLHPEQNDRYGWHDIGNGNLFADWFKNRARYVPKRRKWFVFNGRVWEADDDGLEAMQLAKELADNLMMYALSIKDDNTRQKYVEFVSRWQKRGYRETILKDAAGVYKVSFSIFDRNPMIFNCLNGTLNFETGEFYDHRPEDFLSKLAGVNFVPNARSERWVSFIDEIMQGDKEKTRFLQKALGYALTGDTRYECFFLLYGPKSRNGKGTTMETFKVLTGDYGCAMNPDSIAQKQKANGNGPSEDIARLVGKRFVNISEPDKKLVLSAALVKTLTGNDTINARYLNENSFEFLPDFKLFINTNHLPQVTDVTLFTSGRVKVIPFERHYEEDEQDKGLKGELAKAENLSGILNWCIEGLRALEEEGFDPPDSVIAATVDYQQRSDKIGRFVAEELEEGSLFEVRTAEVYERYRTWCIGNGFHPENAANFKQSIGKFGEIQYKRPLGAGRLVNPVNLLIGFRLSPKVADFSPVEYPGFVPTNEPTPWG